MNRSSGVGSPDSRSEPESIVLWVGAASLLTASLSYAFAWKGGLWWAPVWLALAVGTWWAAWPRRTLVWTRAGVVIAGVAVLIGGYAFVSSGGFQPALRTDSSSYLPGDVVGVRLKAGILPVGYNLCFAFATLERLDGDGWDPVGVYLSPQDGEAWYCTTEGLTLPPLLSAKDVVYLPSDLPSGGYRLAYEVEVDGEPRKVATRGFVVARPTLGSPTG
ncbi:MAG: hypothetical protein ACRDHO_01430 [Actinomycetota bacterium]